MGDFTNQEYLSLQNFNHSREDGKTIHLLVLGEVLWDIFEQSTRLGGAPLNFAAHLKRLGYDPLLISAVGNDELGARTVAGMADLGLNTRFLQRTCQFSTGTARVKLGPGDQTSFVISRPAAYDSVNISADEATTLQAWAPAWFYYGTLLSHMPSGKAVLEQLLKALPSCLKFYDLNLRRGYESAPLVNELLARADVVKLNEEELDTVRKFTGLPSDAESFCRDGSKRYGWRAVCVTLGARGCAMLRGEEYVEAGGHAVEVADPVGAGDAFAAAFLHGLISEWPVAKIASFGNRMGALVASRHGAIPDWTREEVVE